MPKVQVVSDEELMHINGRQAMSTTTYSYLQGAHHHQEMNCSVIEERFSQ